MKKIFTLITLLCLGFGAMAQTNVYEWKNGSVTIRTTNDIDSLTFSIADDAVTFTTGSPSALTEKSMTASFTLSTTLNITNSSSTTEQGVCYSSENNNPTVSDSKVVYGSFYKGSWSATLSNLRSGLLHYYRPYLKIADAIFYGPVKSFTTLGEYSEIPNGAVDLGLPSGTLWADRNVGADSPEAYGDYFAWGETTPKDYYYWSKYKWCKGSYTSLTKYCIGSSYGTVDNKTTLDLEDDAAYVNMGEEWRMPTIDEQFELQNKCTWTWTTQNGTKGYKVTGPNGNYIFLPAAGDRYYSELYGAGSRGYYWSSSLSDRSPDNAWSLDFYSSNHGTYDCDDRYYGRSVRAVVR
ncbi:MAG: DUF1566 domain-containing protein [Bacteroidaceae bacterium]|nr:DUF1566 domain-containing protein [Bacteroidaceae bacterium]